MFAKAIKVFLVLPILFFLCASTLSAQRPDEPWATEQLMEPADLAKMIERGNEEIHVFSIGPSAMIKGSLDIGEGKNPGNIETLQRSVSALPMDAQIIIYCGCCPFANCPNIRPAFQALNSWGFTNHKLLNLSENLKVDWIDQDFPVKQ